MSQYASAHQHVPGPQHVPPPNLHGHSETSHVGISPDVEGEIVKLFPEADSSFNLAVQGDEIVVVKANDSDPFQQWVKDESFSNKAKDSAGLPAFSLVNRGSGKALRHPSKAEEKVSQSTFHSKSLEEEVLWTYSADVGRGWHAIRAVSNIKLNLDIDHGSKKYGPIKEGQAVIVFTWKDEENQHWKIEPIKSHLISTYPSQPAPHHPPYQPPYQPPHQPPHHHEPHHNRW